MEEALACHSLGLRVVGCPGGTGRAHPNTGLLDGEKLAVLAPSGSNAQDHASILTLYYPIPSRSLLQDAKVPGPGAYEPVQDERGDNAEARAGLTLTLTLTLSLILP